MGKSSRKVPGLNSSSTADISFILLIFFLVTTSMDTDMGLARRLPEWDPNALEQENKIKERNVLRVKINFNNEIFCKGKLIEIGELKDIAKEFISNPANDPNLPVKEEYEIPGFGTVMSPQRHVIALEADYDTEYETYFMVQNELGKAYNELRDDWCYANFHRFYAQCDEDQQSYARGMYPSKISESEMRSYGQNAE